MKYLIAASTLLFSLNGFCCKPASLMAGESLFISGITNKLRSMESFRNFEIIEIRKGDFKYEVKISNSENNVCKKLTLESFGTGSCEFTANILKTDSIDCKSL